MYRHRNDEGVNLKNVARARSLVVWQHEWYKTSKELWTQRLIKNIEAWTNCKHKTLEYFLTQFLSGHGSFRAYTTRMGIDDDDGCVYCGEVDTVEHTIFAFEKWVDIRNAAYHQLGAVLTPETVIVEMLKSQENGK